MSQNREAGKGDTPRPIENWDQYANNWDTIFAKKPEKKVELTEQIEADNGETRVSFNINIPL